MTQNYQSSTAALSKPALQPRAVIVVPTYNERDNVPLFVRRVFEALPNCHIHFIDDNSPDGTGDLVQALSEEDPRISLMRRQARNGLGAAYVAGYTDALNKWPSVEYFIQMDADLSHDPQYLPAMLDAMDTADVAIGSRYVHGVSIVNWPLRRLIISRFGTWFAKTVTGMEATDLTSGFKCYRADVLRAIDMSKIRANGYVFQVETSFRAWRLGYKMKDVPIVFHERSAGVSKMDMNIALEAFLVVLRLGVERVLTSPPTRSTVRKSASQRQDVETQI